MNPADQQPLRVNVKGVTDKMLNVLQYFFRDPCNECYEIVNDDAAELTIIDLDGIEGQRLLQEHKEQYPEQSFIVLSTQEQEIDNAIFIQKPLKPETLTEALETISQSIQSGIQAGENIAKKQVGEGASAPLEPEPDPVNPDRDIPEYPTDSVTSVDILLETTGETPVAEAETPPADEPHENEEIPQEREFHRETGVAEDREIPVLSVSPANPTISTPTAATEVIQVDVPGAADPFEPPLAQTGNTRDEGRYIGTAPDIDPQDPFQVASAEYIPEDYFQGHIRQAVGKARKFHKPVLLTMPHGSLAVLPDSKTALLSVSESRLRAFCSLPITDETLTAIFLEKGALQEYSQSATPIDLRHLLWKAALWASRGRVPAGANLQNLVYFQDWPNIPRSLLFTNAVSIAALWVERPCSLIDTAKTLQIPQRYVFAFYSASNAIGIAFIRNGRSKDQNKSRKLKNVRDHNMLGKLLNRLHGAKRKITRQK